MKHIVNNKEYTLSITDAQDNIIIASAHGVSYWNPTTNFDCDKLSKLAPQDINYLMPHLYETWNTAQRELKEKEAKRKLEEKKKILTNPTYIINARKLIHKVGLPFDINTVSYLIYERDTGSQIICLAIDQVSADRVYVDKHVWDEAENINLIIKEQ